MKTLLLPLLLLSGLAGAAPARWPDIRDGALYLTPSRGDTLQLDWVGAWQAAANPEQVFLLDGQGRLAARRDIAADEVRGQQQWPLHSGHGSYRLEIPGYSFRRYRAAFDDSTGVQFAPARLHFSLQVEADSTFYFRVAAGEVAILAGKYHGGVSGLHAVRLEDGKSLSLPLVRQPAYWQYEQVTLPVSPQAQVWRLELQGRGKAAFWLDGTANLFARRVADLQPLREQAGTVNLQLGGKHLGPTAKLGLNLPYLLPPPASHAVLDALRPTAAGFYSFVDVLARQPEYENAFRRLYRERFAIADDITLLAATGRRADLRDDAISRQGLDAWLAASVALGGAGRHYIAFADEPNLNYQRYEDFRDFFAKRLRQVEDYAGARQAGVRIAMPASSRLVNGPLAEHSGERRGLDWAKRLLDEFGPRIDALAWHEWMVRDLLATRVYRDTVRQAAGLVGLDERGRPRKALLLDQTNLSSGSSLSLYEQNGDDAALWWASVAINASADGLLDMLNWFQAADEPEYPKGMLQVLGPREFVLKPVGLAQQFIQQHWLDEVLQLDNDAFEVDVLAMARGPQRSLLGVNKSERRQQVRFASGARQCPAQSELTFFGADHQPRKADLACRGGQFGFELPGRTLFALSWSAS
ncbi:hypothetical protein [Pseudomonas sp. zfem002]|uniref:hypothetical protein n=1 Tax=Pseudomonas sp. zfem002 TaxID=3078197 RepID=UPI002927AA5D|nr:hypothetical protein [Pseudomonas sp. zfem002]MDU9393017.1 hypothetical protein [Pseudomonas sp. zfem002]